MPALLGRRVSVLLRLSHAGSSIDGAAKPNILKEEGVFFCILDPTVGFTKWYVIFFHLYDPEVV